MTLYGHTRQIISLCWSSDTEFLASNSADKTIGIWNLEFGKLIKSLGFCKTFCSNFSPDGKTIVSGSDDKKIRISDIKSGEIL